MIKRLCFWLRADRLGPDIPITHLMLYFPALMRMICSKRFNGFGEGSEFRPGAYADNCSSITIGKNVAVRPGTMLFAEKGDGVPGRIIIEDDVLLGPGIHFYCPNHSYKDASRPIPEQGYFYKGDIVVRRGAWIGAKSVILSGVEIGEHAVVGAGSIVTKSVEPFTVVAGNPARLIKRLR
ncbi:MAG: acetyltransferase [Deltaproteobacteria bacterium GWA2_55_10]|nr:MAG: acetyltransferase [Deltaproteobacteria bacterium GWA2_55_10]